QDAIANFVNSLVKWQQSSFDRNCYLRSWDTDAGKAYQHATLHYVGAKNGRLPPAINEVDEKIQNVSYASFDGTTTIELQYISPTTTRTEIGKNRATSD